jgi:hypothetical protein
MNYRAWNYTCTEAFQACTGVYAHGLTFSLLFMRTRVSQRNPSRRLSCGATNAAVVEYFISRAEVARCLYSTPWRACVRFCRCRFEIPATLVWGLIEPDQQLCFQF